MRDKYVINSKVLNDYKNSLINEKNSFIQRSYKTFSSGYLYDCSDPAIIEMRDNINKLYSTIEKGYTNINNWLNDYLLDTNNIESSFFDKVTVKDIPTSIFIKSNIKGLIDKPIKNASSVISNLPNKIGKPIIDYINDLNKNFYGNEGMYLASLNIQLKKARDQVQSEIDQLELDFASFKYGNDIDPEYEEEYNNATQKLNELKEILALMDYHIAENERLISLCPYQNLKNNDKYKDYLANYSFIDKNIDYDSMVMANYDITSYKNITGSKDDINALSLVEYLINNDETNSSYEEIAHLFPGVRIVVEGETLDAFEVFKYTTDDQKNIYNYIFATSGEEEANKYLSLIIDDINKTKGIYEADQFLNGLDANNEGQITDSLSNLFECNIEGLKDGIITFQEGIDNIFSQGKHLSSEEYKKLAILQALSTNATYSNLLYSFGINIGNMAIPILASAATSALLTPAFGLEASATVGEKVATSMVFASVYGNSKHEALVSGNDWFISNIYGMLCGSSEAFLGYFLGAIPGISKESGLSLISLFKEGLEESAQEYISAGLKCVLLGEPFNISDVSEDSIKAFLMGAATAGILNGGQTMINVTINGIDFVIDGSKISEFINSGKTIDDNSINELLEISDKIVLSNYGKTNEFDEYKIDELIDRDGVHYLFENDPNKLGKLMRNAGIPTKKIIEVFNSGEEGVFDFVQKYRNEILVDNSEYYIYIDEIKFVSDSETNLNRLVDYYEQTKTNEYYTIGYNNETGEYVDFYKDLLNKAEGEELIISNMSQIGVKSHCTHSNLTGKTLVYFNKDGLGNHTDFSTFYHELGHYKDNTMGVSESINYNDYLKYKDKIIDVDSFTKDLNKKELEIKEILNSEAWQNKIEEEAKSKVNPNSPHYNEMLNAYRNMIYNQYVESEIANSGYPAISDIYNALGYTNTKYGHSEEYFSNPLNCKMEIIANLNSLYFTGKYGILYEYFPSELVDNWKNTIEYLNGKTGD